MRHIAQPNERTPSPGRSGVDIGVALRQARSDNVNLSLVQSQERADGSCGLGETPARDAVVSSPEVTVLSFRSRLKQGLRPLVAFAFRLVKPIVRPLAFRLRAYLAAPVISELKRQSEESRCFSLGPQALLEQRLAALSVQIEQGLAAYSLQTEQRLAAYSLQTEQRLAAYSLQMVQELQHTRDMLRRRIVSLSSEFEELTPQLARIERYGYTAARRVALPCGPDEILVRTVAGYVVCPASDAALLATLMEGGEVEQGTHILIQRLLRPGNCFVDVGADIGLHTLTAGFALQGKGRIVAFEPFPQTCRLLRKTLWINGFGAFAEAREAAASDRTGSKLLQQGSTSGRHAQVKPTNQMDGSLTPLEVKLERIDDALGLGAKVDLMRIGAQSVELEAVSGARGIIASNPDIGLIVNFDAKLQRSNLTVEPWLQAFNQLGLDFGIVNQQSGAVESLAPSELASRQSVELFIARPGSPIWDRARAAT